MFLVTLSEERRNDAPAFQTHTFGDIFDPCLTTSSQLAIFIYSPILSILAT